MTTICYKDGVLAADSMLSDNGWHVGEAEKITWVEGVGWFVMAGDYQDRQAALVWFKAGSDPDKRPKLDDSFVGYLVKPDDQFECFDNALCAYTFEPKDGFWAIGSGRSIALGAMAAGASAFKACEIACIYDGDSAGPVLHQAVTKEAKRRLMTQAAD